MKYTLSLNTLHLLKCMIYINRFYDASLSLDVREDIKRKKTEHFDNVYVTNLHTLLFLHTEFEIIFFQEGK